MWAVFGDKGLLGAELTNMLVKLGLPFKSFNRTNFKLDLELDKLAELISDCEIIVNCIAFTDVDMAETQPEVSNLVNGFFPQMLAKAAELTGAKFIHVSSDYVFDGTTKVPYRIDDATCPLTAYGESKLLGELLIQETDANFTILRTAWLYGAKGNCFPKTIARKLGSGPIKVVNDQFGQPTWTNDLAAFILETGALVKLPAILHSVSSGQTTWFEFACRIVESLGKDPEKHIVPCSSLEFGATANRPKFSVLENTNLFVKPIGQWDFRWSVASQQVLDSI